jgi:hypothetical protein
MSALYDSFVEAYLTGAADAVDFDTADIRAILINTAAYSLDLAAHDYLDDIPAGARVKVCSTLTVTRHGRAIDLIDASFTGVSGATVSAIVVYAHTGTDSTSRLIAYIDAATSGLPVTPSGGTITVVWAGTPDYVFSL